MDKIYCLRGKKYTGNKNPTFSRITNGKAVIYVPFCECNSKKNRFIKNQEAKGLLSSLGLKTQLSKISLLNDTLF